MRIALAALAALAALEALPAPTASAQTAAAPATVGGTVFDSLRTMAPLKAATVVINELARYATTDARGRFEFEGGVPAGTYTITFLHPSLDSLLVAAELVPLNVPAAGRVSIRLATPAPGTFVRRVCRTAAESSSGLLIGRVRDVDDSSAVAGAAVRTAWLEFEFTAGGINRYARQNAAQTDERGNYLLCGVPADMTVDVLAALDSTRTGAVGVFLDKLLVLRRDFAISRRRDAVAIVAGSVLTPQRRVASGALIGVLGTEQSTRSTEQGRYALSAVPLGTQSIEAKLIGAQPATVVVDVPSAGNPELTIALAKSIVALPTVSILGRRGTVSDKTGFGERQRQGLGYFMDETDLRKHADWDLESLLARAPGLAPQWGRAGRYYTMRGTFAGPCIPNYYVDGAPWFAMDMGSAGSNVMKDISSVYRASDLRGVEVYRGLGSIPARFDRGNGCGSVVIWTK